MRFSCSAVDPDTTSEMPRVVEGSHATSDHAELPSVGVDDVEAPADGRAAAAGEELDAMQPPRGRGTRHVQLPRIFHPRGGLLPPCYR